MHEVDDSTTLSVRSNPAKTIGPKSRETNGVATYRLDDVVAQVIELPEGEHGCGQRAFDEVRLGRRPLDAALDLECFVCLVQDERADSKRTVSRSAGEMSEWIDDQPVARDQGIPYSELRSRRASEQGGRRSTTDSG